MGGYGNIPVGMVEDDVDYCDHCYENADVGGDQLSVPIHEEHHDKCGEDQGGQDEIQRVKEYVGLIGNEYPHKSVQCFDYSVAGGDLSSAGTAFAFQQAPADYRDKVPALDLGAAGHAVRIALDKRFFLWQAVDADI